MLALYRNHSPVRKHRAPKGALRRGHEALEAAGNVGEKATSAKRCIKTPGYGSTDAYCRGEVRKHQAPKGALRLVRLVQELDLVGVRKHQAP